MQGRGCSPGCYQLKSLSGLLGCRTCSPSITLSIHFYFRTPNYCPCGMKYCFLGCLLGKGSCFSGFFPLCKLSRGELELSTAQLWDGSAEGNPACDIKWIHCLLPGYQVWHPLPTLGAKSHFIIILTEVYNFSGIGNDKGAVQSRSEAGPLGESLCYSYSENKWQISSSEAIGRVSFISRIFTLKNKMS